MSKTIKLTILVENSVHQRGLVAEHGLAFHVQRGSQSLLLDTGQSDLALINAETLSLPLERLDAVVLSHGHYDHTGGLPAILEVAPQARVYLHPAAFEPKFSRNQEGPARMIGMSDCALQAIRRNPGGYTESCASQEVMPGVFTTGEIPRVTPYEDVGGRFFLDESGAEADSLTDDQALFFDTVQGLVVLSGCAHAGVVNTLTHIQKLRPGRPFYAIMGGLHLLNASPERLHATMEALGKWDIPLLMPAHCTGPAAAAKLWESFPGRCATPGVGSQFDFEM